MEWMLIKNNENYKEGDENYMEDDENQTNEVEIGDKCSYSGVLSATEELVRYDVSILYDLATIESPVKITEIDGFYNENGNVEIGYFSFQNFVMHRASTLLYTIFHPFNSSLRKAIQRAGLLEDGQEVEDIWI